MNDLIKSLINVAEIKHVILPSKYYQNVVDSLGGTVLVQDKDKIVVKTANDKVYRIWATKLKVNVKEISL